MRISSPIAAAVLLSMLSASALAADVAPGADEKEAVTKVIASYAAALEAKSLDRLGALVTPDLLVLEGVHKNLGWPDYRDNHIGPEMREWKALKIEAASVHSIEVSGELAVAVQESIYEITTAEKASKMRAAETFVLRRSKGAWRICHVHFSGKPIRPGEAKK